MPVNEYGWSILKKSYAAPGENCAEDVFRRVAKVCSIPDVIEILAQKGLVWPQRETDPHWSTVFSPYEDLAKRCWERSYSSTKIPRDDGVSVAEAQEWWQKIFSGYFALMSDLDFMPASPTLINAGRGGMLSSCFFMRVGDSIEEIFEIIKKAAIVLKMGGGVGFDVSEIRPAGSLVKSYGGIATGPLSYLEIINTMGDRINQAGARKAALMAVLRVDHPDILDFIRAKETEGVLTNFNFSVSLTDEFIRAVEADTTFTLRHPRSADKREIPARELWDAIIEGAWRNGEPGVIFADTVAAGDVFSGGRGQLGPNPCLPAYAPVITRDCGVRKVCDLKTGDYIWSNDGWTKVVNVWISGEKEVVRHATKAGDLVCTADHVIVSKGEKTPISAATCIDTAIEIQEGHVVGSYEILERKSLGIQKVYDLTVDNQSHTFWCYGFNVSNCGELLLLDMESCNLATINLSNCVIEEAKVFNFEKFVGLVRSGIRFLDNIVDINNYPLPEVEANTLMTRRVGLGVNGLHDAMLKLGLRYGDDESLEFIHEVFDTMKQTAEQTSAVLGKERGIPPALEHLQRRNAGLLTAQPTGSVSQIMNQVSSGIEPVYKMSYDRKDSHGIHAIEHFMLQKFGDSLPPYAVTALQISPEEHIAVQAAVQKYLCASISKTINMANDSTREDVARAFLLAHTLHCKSVTVYREGSRKLEVLSSKKEKEQQPVDVKSPVRSRPRVLFGATFRTNTPSGKAYITLNEDKEGLREVFIHVSKAGSEISTYVEANGRLISNSLKYRIPVESLINHMQGIKSNPVFELGAIVKSVPDAVALIMREFIETYEGFSEYIDDNRPQEDKPAASSQASSGGLCASCGEPLYMESRCEVCHSCGFSKCG